MNTSRAIAGRAAAIACALLALPVAAGAQDASAEQQAPRTQGPMTVERVKSGFVVTPEVKITTFDHRTSELIGADGGWLANKMFFIGGGGYWMVNQSHDEEFAYGGLVMGLSTPVDSPFSFGVKTLIGGGTATVGRSVTVFNNGPGDIRVQTPGGRPTVIVPTPVVTNVRYHDDFFVVEPQAHVAFKMSKWIRVTAGAGYRWTGHYYYYYYGGTNGLSGATGSVGLQIGGGG